MISPLNQELLTGAIDRVVQARASAQQAQRDAALRPAAAAAKAKPAAKAKSTAAKPKAKAAAAQDSSITPYLTSTDLMGLNDQTAARDNAVSAAKAGITNAAADGMQAYNDAGRQGVANVAAANNNAAARGLYDSGIRAGNVGMAQAAALRAQSGAVTKLGLATQQGYNNANAAQQQLSGYLQALTAKAAENGAALPVAPGNQNGAVNVAGAKTIKNVAAKQQKGVK